VGTSAEQLSQPGAAARLRHLRALTRALEAGVGLLVAGSALAFGAVHPWAYVPLWCACLGLGALLTARAWMLSRLRRRHGSTLLALDAAGRRIFTGKAALGAEARWRLDLSRPAFLRGPLLLPGLLFAAWASFQVVPLPPALAARLGGVASPAGEAGAWAPLSVSTADTRRGLAFLLSALVVHAAAGAALYGRAARRRLPRGLAALGLLLAGVALAQLGTQTQRIYWFFTPLEGEGGTLFGPFVNRNHFAGYMLMIVPASFAFLGRAWRRYAWRAGERPSLRRRLVGLQSEEGIRLLYAVVPALATLAALLASTSRGALLAFALSLGGLALAARGRGAALWITPPAFALLVFSWLGTERLEERFARVGEDSIGRTAVWRDTLARMDGLWLTGSGFNTFATAMGRAVPWQLPAGATPWPAELFEGSKPRSAVGFRTPPGAPRLSWYREAHNDYLQVLVETGLPGLLLALWAAGAVLAAARHEPWRLAALSSVLLHELVDFDLQIPAIGLLFVTLAAVGRGDDVSAKGSGSQA